ncbi:hypothetical protein [Agaribacter flavus]|uniref:Uncharacterized protein n=1 Tax=Agaribacter flavus TaxID=1902781 RepID=A0ABV7FRR7_9ALTE
MSYLKTLTAFFFCAAATQSMQLNASTKTFQASVTAHPEAEFSETQALNFGTIATFVGASCALAADGSISGNCDASFADASTGNISVGGLLNNTLLNIQVSGSTNSYTSMTAQGNAILGSRLVPLEDGVPVQVNVGEDANNFNLKVFGAIEVKQTLEAGQNYHNDYTVEVSFQ